jgi:hypothetical protein
MERLSKGAIAMRTRQDHLICALAIQVLALWLVDYLKLHDFAVEALIATLNVLITVYLIRGRRK